MKVPSSAAVIILGQILEKDRSLPYSLQQRVLMGVSLWCRKDEHIGSDVQKLSCIVLSGGDAAGIGLSEALAMKKYMSRYLHDTDSFVVLEQASKNTVENALNCKDILLSKGCQCVHLITNEFHMPRTKCIFECIFQSKPCLDAVIICHPANSRFEKGPYRRLEVRPPSAKMWRLCERLDWERNAIETLNDYLRDYKLGPIKNERLQIAMEELRAINVTSRL
jgi:hypothetical protein